MSEPRVLVVGAGPAGVRATEALVAGGLRPVVVDESPRCGGQIYRQPPDGFTRPGKALYSFEAGRAQRLHRAFAALEGHIDYRPETLVWNVRDGVAHTARAREQEWLRGEIPFDALIIATGAHDRVVPFPGWTSPGVYTLGGAQVALKYQGCAVGRRVAFVGTGPLLTLVAWQYAKAGTEAAAVIDSATLGTKIGALGGLLKEGAVTLAKGLYYTAGLRARGVPLVHGALPLEAMGDGRVEGLRYRDGAGRDHEISCDAIATGYGLAPEARLADIAGCRFAFHGPSRQWLPETDGDGRTAAARVYLAGDGMGIAGATAAEDRGALAAYAVLANFGRGVPMDRVAEHRRRLGRSQRFAAALDAAFAYPADLARAVADDTILCRCEAIRAGELRRAARDLGADELNRAKALTRLAMGRCQGRICGTASAEVLAAALSVPVERVERLRSAAPAKPVPLAMTLEP
ncbi:MAG: FAD/NAD(P)-binding oxidoreductase [Alphaproteobacteria bacterium]